MYTCQIFGDAKTNVADLSAEFAGKFNFARQGEWKEERCNLLAALSW